MIGVCVVDVGVVGVVVVVVVAAVVVVAVVAASDLLARQSKNVCC